MQKFVSFAGALLATASLLPSPVLASAGGTISGKSTSAVSLSSGTETITSAGSLTVSGSSVAITVTGSSSIVNSGTIDQSGSGRAIRDNSGGLTLSVTNSGTIESNGDDTFQMNVAGSTVTLTNTGTIEALGTGGSNGQAIDWNALDTNTGSNTLHNNAGGVISAADSDAVRPGQNGVITNDGTILAKTGSSSSNDSNDGIDLQDNTNVQITNANANLQANANLIEGARHGITGGDSSTNITLSVTNNSFGTIKGDDGSGINIDGTSKSEVVTIVNSGLIQGTGVTGDGDGVDVDGLVNLTNNSTGTIVSKNSFGTSGTQFSEGVTVGGGTITNAGTIQGSVKAGNKFAVGRGITLAGLDQNSSGTTIPIQSIFADSTITNTGLIKGDTESGIAVLGTTSGAHTVTINNNEGGTIEGNNSGVSEDTIISGSTLNGQSLNQAAIELDDKSNTYVLNESGTITQDATTTGTAVAMHGVKNTMNITGGTASVTGNISGDTAADSTLNINPGTGNSFSYGYVISNFTVNVNADGKAGKVTLSGANIYSGTTSVQGGTLTIANLTGSGTGTGKVAVSSGATLGGTGIIQPGAGNGITMAAGSTLVSGGAQSGNTAGAGLTLDNTVAKSTILDASLGNVTLSFTLGANYSASTLKVLGSTTAELKFASTDMIALTDLNNTPLALFGTGTPFVLIQAGATPSAADNAFYSGLITTGGKDANGNPFNGYVESLVNISLNGVNETGKLQLYLNDGELEVVPEPSTWAMMIGGLGVLLLIQARRRKS